MEKPPSKPQIAVVVDAAGPSGWPACRRLLTFVEALASDSRSHVAVTLVVSPPPPGETTTVEYVQWLRECALSGHELALKGLPPVDPPSAAPTARHPRRRRSEPVALAMTRTEALRRIAHARQWAAACNVDLAGFVADAEPLGDSVRSALRASGFLYACTAAELVALPGRQAIAVPLLRFGPAGGWRRRLSLLANPLRARLHRQAALLRLELDPARVDDVAVRAGWTSLLADQLRHRDAVALSTAAGLARLREPAVAEPERVKRGYRRRLRRIP